MTKLIDILLVEDNPADVELTLESLAISKFHLRLSTSSDGEDALFFLRREDPHRDAPRPDLVLLDLNLPKRDGREVLSEIKKDPTLRSIPVVVLTSSDAEADVLKTYDLGANCYIKKPVGLAQFQKIVDSIEQFWFTVVKLPGTDDYSVKG